LLATFAEPWAIDANGQSVPVSLGFSDGTVTMTVDFHEGDYALPIVADPDLIDCAHQPFVCGHFDRDHAVKYAKKWRASRNPDYPQYDSDCTNFVSQVLHAGHMKFSAEWRRREGAWWSHKVGTGYGFETTNSWSRSETLHHHLNSFELVRRIRDQDNWRKGDILFYEWRDINPDKLEHTNVVVDIRDRDGEPMPYLLQHAQDYHHPRSLKAFRKRAKDGDEGGVKTIIHMRPVHTRINLNRPH
jgi:putative amidase-like protein